MCTFSRRLNPSLKCTQLLMEICQIAQTTYFPNDQDCLVGNTFFWYSQYLLLSRIFNHEGVIMMKGASRRLNPSLKCTQLLMEICQIAQTTYFPDDQDCLVGNTSFLVFTVLTS